MKKMNLLLPVMLLFFIGQTFAAEKAVTLETPTGTVYGTLATPDNAKKCPLVIFVSGSGPTDRNGNNPQMQNNALKMLSDSLMSHRIASLRYDKRGIAESKNNVEEKDLRFEDYIMDLKAWIKKYATDTHFSKIIIAGHSEGALIGLAAALDSPNVDALISIAGAGRPADEILKQQLSTLPGAAQQEVFSMIDSLKAGHLLSNVPMSLYSLFRPSVQPYMISWFAYDPQILMAKLKCPTLIIQGTTDIQIGVDDAERLAAANPKARKELITNMNHILKTCESKLPAEQTDTYVNPTIPINGTFVGKCVAFIRSLD